jgi:hypothetical protein
MHYWTYLELRKILAISFQAMKRRWNTKKKSASSDDAWIKEGGEILQVVFTEIIFWLFSAVRKIISFQEQ